MERYLAEQPQSTVWPLIRAHLIETKGDSLMVRKLPDGTIVQATVAQAFEQCVDLDIIGNKDPALLTSIIQEGINQAEEL